MLNKFYYEVKVIHIFEYVLSLVLDLQYYTPKLNLMLNRVGFFYSRTVISKNSTFRVWQEILRNLYLYRSKCF